MPVIQGEKTAGERFPGAVAHVLHRSDDAGPQGAAGRHVALPRPELRQGVRASSSTTENGEQRARVDDVVGRLDAPVGGLIMTHADDDGLVLPPRLAPAHVVILPIDRRSPRTRSAVLDVLHARSQTELRAQTLRRRAGARRASTTATSAAATRVWQWIKKGVPLRLEIGPRDIDKDSRVHGPPRQARPRTRQAIAARRVRRDDRRRSSQEIQDASSRARRRIRERAHARDRHQGRVLRVLRRPDDEERERPDADPRRLRADALQRRPRARGQDQGRPRGHRPLHPARRRRARHLPVHRPAERKRVVWAKSYEAGLRAGVTPAQTVVDRRRYGRAGRGAES